jgi:hypothetical protein
MRAVINLNFVADPGKHLALLGGIVGDPRVVSFTHLLAEDAFGSCRRRC